MKLLSDGVAFVPEPQDLPPSFYPLSSFPVIILVGLTGVGKTTVVTLLQNSLDFILLPNRREITDEIIIASLQQADGVSSHIVADRIKRFEYTARFRARHPGGMAFALSLIAVDPGQQDLPLFFDGLRGLNEIQHASEYLPQARFIVLDAPDIVRLTRLLKRADTFDTTQVDTSLAGHNLIAGLMSIPNIDAVFTQEQLRQISRIARAAHLSINDVVKKAAIIVEERRNYDSSAARVFLTRTLPGRQVLVIDTENSSPSQIANQINVWLNTDNPPDRKSGQTDA